MKLITVVTPNIHNIVKTNWRYTGNSIKFPVNGLSKPVIQFLNRK